MPIHHSSILWTLNLNQSPLQHRVTLDFTVDNLYPSSNWNWNKLLELNDSDGERVKSLYVENLGEIAHILSVKLRAI